MTREDAINKLKHLCSPEQMTALKILVPELQESEDERIRKWLIKAVHLIGVDKDICADQETMDKAIAWLEKQKASADYANEEYWRGYREGKQEVLDKYAELEKQKEQKSSIEICPHSTKSKSYKGKGCPIEDCDYGLEIAFDILEKTFGEVRGYQTDDGIREHQTAIEAVRKAKEQKPVGWKPEPESLEALMYAIEGKWEMIKPTSYLSRRLEDLYEGVVNTFDIDEKYLGNLPKTEYTEKDIEEIKALKEKIDSSIETRPAECLDGKVNENVELTPFESVLFSAFSDAWQKYMLGEPVNVAHWAKEHSEGLLEVAKGDSAKWSEEDEDMLESIIKDYDYLCKTWLSDYEKRLGATDLGVRRDTREQISWLKSLRPQPHWKPSEEQMDALEECGECKRCLKELYEQLKKLM